MTAISNIHLNRIHELLNRAKQDDVQKYATGGLITNAHHQVLILKRRPDDFMPDIYELPGGGLEKNEGIIDGLIRELLEETGIHFTSIASILETFDYPSSSGKTTRQFNFKITLPEKAQITLSEEHVDYRWISSVNEIPAPGVSHEVKAVINSYFAAAESRRT